MLDQVLIVANGLAIGLGYIMLGVVFVWCVAYLCGAE